MRTGILADIHGNRWALEAVLDDAAGRAVDRWVNLGDCFYGPLDPAGTAELLRPLDAVSVGGNQDRNLVSPPEGMEDLPTFRFVRGALSAVDLDWLATLPATTVAGEVYLCHGTPRSDVEPLLEEVREGCVSLRPATRVAESLGAMTEPVVACGHTHVPRLMLMPSGRLVINPGSVGLPAYTDDSPFPHAMEAGSPHARYAILEERGEGRSVEQLAVPYDWEAAARQARGRERPDWTQWLRTGRAALSIGEP